MSQTEINQNEWSSAENWNGRLIPGLYFSRRDSRLWVPKRVPYLGWTLNLAHPSVTWLITAFALLLIVAALLAGYSLGQA